MSWGPTGNMDMWNKQEVIIKPDVAVLAYGPLKDLLVKKKGDFWYWKEKKSGHLPLKAGKRGYDTFIEAVNDYEERG